MGLWVSCEEVWVEHQKESVAVLMRGCFLPSVALVECGKLRGCEMWDCGSVVRKCGLNIRKCCLTDAWVLLTVSCTG